MNAKMLKWHERVSRAMCIKEPVTLNARDAALLIGLIYRRFDRESDETTWAMDVLSAGSQEFRE